MVDERSSGGRRELDEFVPQDMDQSLTGHVLLLPAVHHAHFDHIPFEFAGTDDQRQRDVLCLTVLQLIQQPRLATVRHLRLHPPPTESTAIDIQVVHGMTDYVSENECRDRCSGAEAVYSRANEVSVPTPHLDVVVPQQSCQSEAIGGEFLVCRRHKHLRLGRPNRRSLRLSQ